MSVGFEWDASKGTLNLSKHRVSFDEATTVFDDLNHSSNERREIIVGHSVSNRFLLVCFSERTDIIRIFSARPVTGRERKDYEENIHK